MQGRLDGLEIRALGRARRSCSRVRALPDDREAALADLDAVKKEGLSTAETDAERAET